MMMNWMCPIWLIISWSVQNRTLDVIGHIGRLARFFSLSFYHCLSLSLSLPALPRLNKSPVFHLLRENGCLLLYRTFKWTTIHALYFVAWHFDSQIMWKPYFKFKLRTFIKRALSLKLQVGFVWSNFQDEGRKEPCFHSSLPIIVKVIACAHNCKTFEDCYVDIAYNRPFSSLQASMFTDENTWNAGKVCSKEALWFVFSHFHQKATAIYLFFGFDIL